MTLESTLVVDRTWKFGKLTVMSNPLICNPLGSLERYKDIYLVCIGKLSFYKM